MSDCTTVINSLKKSFTSSRDSFGELHYMRDLNGGYKKQTQSC